MALAVTERLAGRWFIFIEDAAIAVEDVSAVAIEAGNPEYLLTVHLKSGRSLIAASFRGSRRGPDSREIALDALDEVLLALAEIPDAEVPEPHVDPPPPPPEKEMLALPTGEVRPSAAAAWVARLRWRLRL